MELWDHLGIFFANINRLEFCRLLWNIDATTVLVLFQKKRNFTSLFPRNIKRSLKTLQKFECPRFPIPEIQNVLQMWHVWWRSLTAQKKLPRNLLSVKTNVIRLQWCCAWDLCGSQFQWPHEGLNCESLWISENLSQNAIMFLTGEFSETDAYLQKKWQHEQHIAGELLSRWTREFFWRL